MKLKSGLNRNNIMQHLDYVGFKMGALGYYQRIKGNSRLQCFGNQYHLKILVSHETPRADADWLHDVESLTLKIYAQK